MIKMTDKIYSPQQIKSILRPVFKNHNIKKAVLFGSYAKGEARKNSDVDIMVDSGLKGLSFFGLLEDVSVSLDKNIDMIDTTQIAKNSEIDMEISKNGVQIYG